MRPVRLAAVTAALLLVPATAAWAHPSLDPSSVPIGQPVQATLVVPHGCSTGAGVMPEDAGEAVPTTRFDLQVLDGLTVEPGDVEGWDTEVQPDAVVWTDAGGATTDPIELPLTLTVESGEPGDQLALSAHQQCENGDSVRWTDGSEDTPPVALELTAGVAGTTPPDATPGSEADGGSDDTSGSVATEDDTAVAEPVGEPAASSTSPTAVVLVLAVLGLAILGGMVLARRRGAS